MEDYLKINKATWNDKTSHHLDSDFYNVAGFLEGESVLNSIELNLLGDVKNKKVLHLQCHFGLDTLELARMGAKVTGVDFSEKAIAAAKAIADKAGLEAQFICSDIYNLPNVLDDKYDVVFTSYGTIGWLPDINKWAKTVSHFLKPNGQFVFAEFHPFIWMFNDEMNKIEYRYFNADPIVTQHSGTYAEKEADMTSREVGWNHGLAEVISSLMKENLDLISFQEFDYSPYDCFSNLEKISAKKYRFKKLGDKIPMVYALKMIKKS